MRDLEGLEALQGCAVARSTFTPEGLWRAGGVFDNVALGCNGSPGQRKCIFCMAPMRLEHDDFL